MKLTTSACCDYAEILAKRIRHALIAMFALAAPSLAQVPTTRPVWLPGETKYDVPFFEGAHYDAKIATPDDLLGFTLGSRPARHAELERCLNAWKSSPKLKLVEYARSHEQRTLWYAVITSEKNHARLADIRAAIAKLADPRLLNGDAEAESLAKETPAVAWLAYSIHGDEISSTDAALAVIHHLIASTDADVAALLDELVICVDPLMNPDGRDRFIHQIDQAAGWTPCLDEAAVQHGGRWPYGRGNHYLFDMNRDWMAGVHPETRGRQKAVSEWHPQLLVDSHEMGGHDTYLFNPAREPINPHVAPFVRKWWQRFAGDQGVAFDRFAWSYYTREWLDFWYPGYSDGYGAYQGACAILYEQAGIGGSPIRQANGMILTYRETVHHQAISSITNLRTLKANRVEILTDYVKQKREALTPSDASPEQTFVLVPGRNPTRERRFLDNLRNQGVEIHVADSAFRASSAVNTLGERCEQREFPAGSYLIARQQPLAALVGAYLDFDPRMTKQALEEERRELETKRDSRIYDITGWSLPLACDLDAFWCDGALKPTAKPYEPRPAPAGIVQTAEQTVAFVIDGSDDAVPIAVAHLLQNGVKVRVADKEFRAAGRSFPRGSVLVRKRENGAELPARLAAAAQATGVTVHAATTGRSPDDGPDLGGGQFPLLHSPRVALLGGSPVNTTAYGAIWHLLDHELGLSISLFDASSRGALDLRRYDVLIVPPCNGDAVIRPMLEELKAWIETGGTLVAVGGSAAWLADEKIGLSGVRRRPDVLKQLDEYAYAVSLERSAGRTSVEPEAVWTGAAESQPSTAPTESTDKEFKVKALDDYRQVFSPVGVILRGETNPEHWLTYGCSTTLPVFAAGSIVLLSKHPTQTAVRLAPANRLRLSGLLWPEAAIRLADSAYATVERVGNGQVILFAQEPDFRGFWQGTRRLLINAVLLGPGCGTSQPVPH